MDIYNLSNSALVEAFKTRDMETLKKVASKSIFLIPVKNKNNVEKISSEVMVDSKNEYYLPLFINMADMKAAKLIKGRQVLVAHFGMIETILKNTSKLTGIVINPCTMDCRFSLKEANEISSLYKGLEDKPMFEEEFHEQEITKMSDYKKRPLEIREELSLTLQEYLKETPIKKCYVTVKMRGNKKHYQFILDYSNKDAACVAELQAYLETVLVEDEEFELSSTKSGLLRKLTKSLTPIYQK